MLERLELENVGPSLALAVDLAPRLNLITGDRVVSFGPERPANPARVRVRYFGQRRLRFSSALAPLNQSTTSRW